MKINNKFYIIAYSIFLSVVTSSTAYAVGGSLGAMRLIKLMQAATFWIGVGVAIWGIVEAMLDYPGWRARILKGILGYIAILVLPLVFIEIRQSLYVDVWNEIDVMLKEEGLN